MIRDATLADILYVCTNMRKVDHDEIFGMRDYGGAQGLAVSLWSGAGIKKVWDKDGVPVAVGGLQPLHPYALDAWLFGTDQWKERIIQITRDVRKIMDIFHSDGVKRIQAVSWEGHKDSHEWLISLGYKKGNVMTSYGINGCDYYMFERIR